SHEMAGLAPMLMRANGTDTPGPVLYVQGPAGAGKRGRALAACAAVQRPALIVDLPALLALSTETSMSRTLAAVAREALLQDAVLCFENFDEILRDEAHLATSRQVVRRLLSHRRGATLLLGERRWEPGVWLGGVPAARVEVASLGPSARAQLWRM